MPKFKNKKEWENFVDKGLASGKTPQEMNKLAGMYDGPEGRFTVQQDKGSKRGWISRNKDKKAASQGKRIAEGKKQDAELVDTLKKGGKSTEEAEGILKQEKDAYKRIEHQASDLNREHGRGAFNAGHETAAIEGGGNYGSNARLEIGKSRVRADGTRMRGNQSRGKLDETPDNVKPAMGIPRSGRGGKDTALFHLLESDVPGIMDLGLTPHDKQEIKKDPANADDIITRRQSQPKPTKYPKINLLKPTQKPPIGRQRGGMRIKSEGGFVNSSILDTAGKFIKNNWKGELLGGLTGLATDPAQRQRALDGDYKGLVGNGIKDAFIGGAVNSLTNLAIRALPAKAAAIAAPVVSVAAPVIAGYGLGSALIANKDWRDSQELKRKHLRIYGSDNWANAQIGLPSQPPQPKANPIQKVVKDGMNHLEYAVKNPLSIFGL